VRWMSAKTLLANSFVLGTTGQTWCMAKLISDNRVIGTLFCLMALLNAFAIQNNWYA